MMFSGFSRPQGMVFGEFMHFQSIVFKFVGSRSDFVSIKRIASSQGHKNSLMELTM